MFRELAEIAKVALALVALSAPLGARAQCRTVCMPDEERDRAGCCVAIAAEGALDPTIGCAAGTVRTAETHGECCWPGQVFGEGACRGIPTRCPTGHAVRGEACALVACAPGRVRAGDGVTCCWPGQVASAGRCRGVPSSCPPTFDVVGEGCSDERHRAAVAAAAAHQQAIADEAERERLAAIQAERDAINAAHFAASEAAQRRGAITAARQPVFFGGASGIYYGGALATALPPIFESFLYLSPRLTIAFGFDAFETLFAFGAALEPEGPLVALDVHLQGGVSLLSFPNAARSAFSFLNLSIGAFGNMWAGEVPDDLTLFGGVYFAETAYLGCLFAVRVQYTQTLFGMHGPISPSVDVSLLFGSRRVSDPDGSCR